MLEKRNGWRITVASLDVTIPKLPEPKDEKKAIAGGIELVCERLGIDIIAEGVETAAESEYLRSIGIRHQQGYYFAKPGWESLPLSQG